MFVFVKNIFFIHGVLIGLLCTSNDFCFAQCSKNSAWVTKNSKLAGDQSHYAGDQVENLETPAKCGRVDSYAKVLFP